MSAFVLVAFVTTSGLFAVSAYDNDGLESGYSNEADKLIIE